MTTFTKKITFTNVAIAYGGCGCCEDSIRVESGPYVVFVKPNNESIETHAKIAFGSGVVSFDYKVEE